MSHGKDIDIGLNARINDFAKKFGIDRTQVQDHDIFEDFSNYIIGSTLIEEEYSDFRKLSTGKAEGIDGIAIVINSKIINDLSDLEKLGQDEKIDITIAFVQSTLQSNFDSKKFSSFCDKVASFLECNCEIEPFTSIIKTLLFGDNDYPDRLIHTPRIALYYMSGKTNFSHSKSVIEAENKKFINNKVLENSFIVKELLIVQAENLISRHKDIEKFYEAQLEFSDSLQFNECGEIDFSVLGIIKFSELKNLILTKDLNLRERLFVENVRNYIGLTSVNKDIKKTLQDDKYSMYFHFLNNGITIMCDEIRNHPSKRNKTILKFPRIINGCQTTHILYEIFKEGTHDIDNISIVLKLISTKDNELKKQIIFAANNQNSIDKDLQSLNESHGKVETFFAGNEYRIKLYFERLRGQYPEINPPYIKITIENLAKIFISIFLHKPHEMKSSSIKKIEKYQKDKLIFENNTNEEDKYFYCAVLNYYYHHFVNNKKILLKTQTADMHLLMTVDLLLEKKYNKETIKDKLSYIENEETALKIFNESSNIVNNQKDLYTARGFYSGPKTSGLIDEIKSVSNEK